MFFGPKIITDGLVFAVDPAADRGTYMEDVVKGASVTVAGTPGSSTEGVKTVTFGANGEQYHYGTSNSTRGLEDITIMGWVKQGNTSQPHQTLFCTSRSYRYGLKLMSRYHGQWSAWIGNGGTDDFLVGSGHNITNVDEFYLICCTRRADTSDIALYEDGALKTAATNTGISGSIVENSNTAYGSEYHSQGYYHFGKLGQVWVWDRVLEDSEILSMYKATESRYK